MSVIGRGGENLVNATVRPSGVNVDANTSPVETTPRAKICAGCPGVGPASSGALNKLEQPAAAEALNMNTIRV
jgi:hypothetical protein